jgi:glycosyltransferase involved in cell wall biosynthesis
MADAFDRRPENTLFSRRLIEALITAPDIDLTLIHYKPMLDEPLYKQAREVIIPPMRLPFAGHFFAFLWYCLTTKDEFDIVHSFTARLYPFFWLFPAKHRIVMAHGGGERLAPGKWTIERFTFVAMMILFQKYIDAIIGVSEYANKEIIYAFFVPPEKVHTIYPHLDETYAILPSDKTVSDVLATYGLASGNYFTYIGRFRIHKNVGNLVEAYLRYRENNPEATELLAVGGGTKEEYESVFGQLRSSPFADDIRFLGHIPNDHMPVLYKGARALAFVTLNEGFGVPIIEAMACGTPVITSSVTSMPEVAGDAALIVDPHSPDALAKAFQLLSADAALRAELIRRGSERCRFFTWEKVLQKTFGLYKILSEENLLVYNPVSDIVNP